MNDKVCYSSRWRWQKQRRHDGFQLRSSPRWHRAKQQTINSRPSLMAPARVQLVQLILARSYKIAAWRNFGAQGRTKEHIQYQSLSAKWDEHLLHCFPLCFLVVVPPYPVIRLQNFRQFQAPSSGFSPPNRGQLPNSSTLSVVGLRHERKSAPPWKLSPQQRLHRGEFVLVALVSGGL
jgi:hypothetical protein